MKEARFRNKELGLKLNILGIMIDIRPQDN